jgi:phage shock protein E
MTSNVLSRSRRRADAGVVIRAVSYERHPDTERLLKVKRALAALSLAGALWLAFSVIAMAGEPAVTPTAPVPAAASAAATTPAPAAVVVAPLSQEALLEQQSSHPEHLFVLDVRTPQEYADGHVPGAVNVPYDQLASRLAEVPQDKDVVLYCKSGRRAGIAADVLAANGYTRLSHLEGDMNAWLEKGRPVAKP